MEPGELLFPFHKLADSSCDGAGGACVSFPQTCGFFLRWSRGSFCFLSTNLRILPAMEPGELVFPFHKLAGSSCDGAGRASVSFPQTCGFFLRWSRESFCFLSTNLRILPAMEPGE